MSIVRTINGSWLKGFVFRLGLRIEVVTVNDKHHLIYTIYLIYLREN